MNVTPPAPTVLIINDDVKTRGLIRTVLENAGYEVDEAADSIQGVQSFQRQRADLVLCDVATPEQEGPHTIFELHAHDASVPLVATNGGVFKTNLDYLPVAARLGAMARLHKPLTRHALLALVGILLGQA